MRVTNAISCCALLIALPWTSAAAVEPGLVAHYAFDEDSGMVLKDLSGNGNDGEIHGAEYVKTGGGYCLSFDGIDDYVSCKATSSMDLQKAVTLETWVFPDAAAVGEPGIVGKGFSSFLLTYYTDGKVYWYIHEGGNNCQAVMSPGSWHHVVGTFDGETMQLFLDGKLEDSRVSKHKTIGGTGPFVIGAVIGNPSAADAATRSTSHFLGKIAEVRVYDHALSAEDVKTHYERGLTRFGSAPYDPSAPVERLSSAKLSIVVGARGDAEIKTREGRYLLEAAYSSPGERIRWNTLGGDATLNDASWLPKIRRADAGAIEMQAQCSSYSLSRRIVVQKDRVDIEDRISNTAAEPVAVIIENRLVSPTPLKETLSPGCPESPLIYARSEFDTLGMLAQDDISRRKFEAHLGLPPNRAAFRVTNLAVDAGKIYTMRWTLYVLPASGDYFDLVNRIRCDWNAITTIDGPTAFFDIGQNADLLKDADALKAYFERKRHGIVMLSPWLDYDPGTFDRVWPRDEYKQRMQEATKRIRQANPGAKVIGCIETDWVNIDPTRIPDGDKLPSANETTGNIRVKPEQTKILDRSGLPFLDSVRRDSDGNLIIELYRRGGKPQTSLGVFPAIVNYQYEFLLGQVKFLIDDVGLDGFYIDEFSQAFRNDLRTYAGWDGWSADIDLGTGKITRKYVDDSIAGVEARVKLCQYALQRGKTVVANTYATSMEEQSLPVNRFAETQGSFNPFAFEDGQEPPLVAAMLRGHLATPIGLGILPQSGQGDVAKTIMKAVVSYLRHALLYYHYAIGDIPESGDGSGEYGPINHMFPITPIELHKGWILGKERIITCVSGRYLWRNANPPVIHLFDLRGREVLHTISPTQADGNWQVDLKRTDWAQIAVME